MGGYELTAGEAISNGNPSDDAVDGLWFTFKVKMTFAYFPIYFDLYNYDISSTVPVLSGSLVFIPEPVTVALLGFGGLFLRCRW